MTDTPEAEPVAPVAKPPPIVGAASVTPIPPPLPPAVAVWTVNVEEKTSSAPLLGGTAIISRAPETGKFRCEFKREIEPDEHNEEGAEAGFIQVTFPLLDCTNLPQAQLRAEGLIRENLAKTHPELLKSAVETEAAAVSADAPEDPF
jgi:hypothetical protein